MSDYHILSALVLNQPGVLARVAGLFARRGFNIESLAVGVTEDPDLSRITIVIAADSDQVLEQISKQLNKLVEVIRVIEFERGEAVRRELILVKVRTDGRTRSQVLEIAQMFHAKVVDVTPESVVLEATGTYGKIRSFVDLLEPYGVRELVQSGSIALGRGPRAISDRSRFDKTPKSERADAR